MLSEQTALVKAFFGTKKPSNISGLQRGFRKTLDTNQKKTQRFGPIRLEKNLDTPVENG